MKKIKKFKIVDFANMEKFRFYYTITLERLKTVKTVESMWYKSYAETEYIIHINDVKYIGTERFQSSMTYKQVAEYIANHIEKYLHWTDTELETIYKCKWNRYVMLGFVDKYREIEEMK